MQQVHTEVARVAEYHNACRYDLLIPMLPGLLLDLASGHRRPAQLRMLVWVAYVATFAAKYLGYADLAHIGAQYCRSTAAELDESAWTGLAEFALLHTLPLEARDLATNRGDHIIAVLEPHADDLDTAQVYGMLHLTAAMHKAVGGRSADAAAHLAEADAVAFRTGERNFAHLWFGPTNATIWRVGVYTELGEGARLERLPEINPTILGSSNRQATYYSDLGRGLAQTHRDDQRALNCLLRAEAIAPQRVRLSPAVREAVGSMLRRARSTAGGRELQILARRLGTV